MDVVKPLAVACSTSARANRDFPMPASPRRITTCARPPPRVVEPCAQPLLLFHTPDEAPRGHDDVQIRVTAHAMGGSRRGAVQPTESVAQSVGARPDRKPSGELDEQLPWAVGPEHGNVLVARRRDRADGRDPIEEHVDRDASLESRERGAGAHVRPTAEPEVPARIGAIEPELVGLRRTSPRRGSPTRCRTRPCRAGRSARRARRRVRCTCASGTGWADRAGATPRSRCSPARGRRAAARSGRRSSRSSTGGC